MQCAGKSWAHRYGEVLSSETWTFVLDWPSGSLKGYFQVCAHLLCKGPDYQKPGSYACPSSPPTSATTSPLQWKRVFPLCLGSPYITGLSHHCLLIHLLICLLKHFPGLFPSVLYTPVTLEFSRCKRIHFQSLLPALYWLLVTLRIAY